MNPEDELISKLKMKIGKQLPALYRGMAEQMLEQNKEVIIKWLKENKNLVKEVIES
jgi:flagellin-specific chaperone FliS